MNTIKHNAEPFVKTLHKAAMAINMVRAVVWLISLIYDHVRANPPEV